MNNIKKEEKVAEKQKLSGKVENSERYLEELNTKMKEILKETKDMKPDPEIFKNNSLPLARIKKIMKSDECVKMIAGEAPILFSKACELFIIELAYRSWIHTVESNRRTLQRSDISSAIAQTDFFDFLLDIVEESCKKKLQMYANYQMPTSLEPNSLNNLMTLNNSKFPEMRTNNEFIYPNSQTPNNMMSNYKGNYPQNMMMLPNPSLNYMNPYNYRENDGTNEINNNTILQNNNYTNYPAGYNYPFQEKRNNNQK